MKRSTLTSTVALAAAAIVASAASAEERLSFQACPIVRDTATVPCWLSEYNGELYYLGIQTDLNGDFYPPYLGHQAIVEGVISDEPRICGGVVLDQIKVSPVPERDANCNTLLPAEDRYAIDFNPRPPGPSDRQLSVGGPPRRAETLEPPFEAREFTLYYYFDVLVGGRNAGDLGRIFRYAQQIDASGIKIEGYQGDVLLTDGTLLAERAGLAQERAEQIADYLQQAGLPADRWDVTWTAAEAADGVDDWMGRRAVVTVIP